MERYIQTGAKGRTQKCIFLADKFFTHLSHINGYYFSWIRCGESHATLALTVVGKMGHENGFTGKNSLADIEDRVKHATGRFGAVTHLCFKTDAIFHVVHGARFSNNNFSWIEFHLDNLHVVAKYLVIHLMTTHVHSLGTYRNSQNNNDKKAKPLIGLQAILPKDEVMR